MKEGQVFYTDYSKPDRFCDEAWKAIYQYVFALCNGSNDWYFYDWINTKKHPGVAIVSCNDGLDQLLLKLKESENNFTGV